MDPKHALMRLGLMYLADRQGRTAIHKEFLNEKSLRDEVDNVKVVERDNNFVWIWTEIK